MYIYMYKYIYIYMYVCILCRSNTNISITDLDNHKICPIFCCTFILKSLLLSTAPNCKIKQPMIMVQFFFFTYSQIFAFYCFLNFWSGLITWSHLCHLEKSNTILITHNIIKSTIKILDFFLWLIFNYIDIDYYNFKMPNNI